MGSGKGNVDFGKLFILSSVKTTCHFCYSALNLHRVHFARVCFAHRIILFLIIVVMCVTLLNQGAFFLVFLKVQYRQVILKHEGLSQNVENWTSFSDFAEYCEVCSKKEYFSFL